MSHKPGFLYFGVLTLILVFGAVSPLAASAAVSCSAVVIGDPTDPTDLPIIRVFNEIIGGSAQSADFTIQVMDEDSAIQTQSGLVGGNDFTVKSGSFQVDTSQVNYLITKPTCPGGDQVGNGEMLTYTMVSTYQDTVVPVITLLGDATINLAVGDAYTDAGATASDDIDGDITANIVTVNSVDTNVAGAYLVTYNVSDAAGNHATKVTRTVNVVVAPVVEPPPASPRRGGSGGGRVVIVPANQGLVLGASVINWNALSPAEKEELLAPIRQQLLAFFQRLLALIQSGQLPH